MDVDRYRSPDRRSKSYVLMPSYIVLCWTFYAALAISPRKRIALGSPTGRVLVVETASETEKSATATVATTTTAAVAGTGGSVRTATESMNATASGTGTVTGTETGTGARIVTVSTVAVNEIEPKIDVEIETVRGIGTENTTGKAMTVTTGIVAESVPTMGTIHTMAILLMNGRRGNEATTP